MKKKIKNETAFRLSVAGFTTLSVSLLIMPVQGLHFLPGIVFWIGLLAGVGGQVFLCWRLRERNVPRRKRRWGLVTLCANRWAKLADYGLMLSLLTTVLAVLKNGAACFCYVAMAATVFCFCMHCVLNGRIFAYLVKQGCFRKKPDHKNIRKKEMESDEA